MGIHLNILGSDTINGVIKAALVVGYVVLLGIAYHLFETTSSNITPILLLTVIFTSCTRVKPNESYLYTTDCGDEWHMLKQGDALPTNKVANCFYSLSLPKTSLTGETQFVANFKTGLATITIRYGYVISDELKYITKAKFRFNTGDSDADMELNDKIELAENRLIDLSINEITKGHVVGVNVIDYNHTSLENQLMQMFNEKFVDRGITLEDVAMR